MCSSACSSARLSSLDELIDERVVPREADELPVAVHVGAAVADVCDRDVVVLEVVAVRVVPISGWLLAELGALVDLSVRLAGKFGKPLLGWTLIRQAVLQGFYRKLVRATSPACAPPIPSATANTGGAENTESSFPRRWRPVSAEGRLYRLEHRVDPGPPVIGSRITYMRLS